MEQNQLTELLKALEKIVNESTSSKTYNYAIVINNYFKQMGIDGKAKQIRKELWFRVEDVCFVWRSLGQYQWLWQRQLIIPSKLR